METRDINVVAVLGTAIGDAVNAAVVSASGLSGAAPAALAALRAEPGLGVDALSRTVGVSGSGAVRLADRLSAGGLVERRSGRDGRAVSLWLTPAGRSAADRVVAARREVVERVAAGLDREEQGALVRLAEKMLAGFTEGRGHAEWLCRLCDVAACPSPRCPVEQAVS